MLIMLLYNKNIQYTYIKLNAYANVKCSMHIKSAEQFHTVNQQDEPCHANWPVRLKKYLKYNTFCINIALCWLPIKATQWHTVSSNHCASNASLFEHEHLQTHRQSNQGLRQWSFFKYIQWCSNRTSPGTPNLCLCSCLLDHIFGQVNEKSKIWP